MTKVPTGVKVISVLYWVGALVCVGASVFAFIGLQFLLGPLENLGIATNTSQLAFIGMGIFFLLLSILNALLGWGLWTARNWARILAIIFTGLGALIALLVAIGSPESGAVSFVFNAVIAGYLLFDYDTKKAFTA